MTARKKMKTAIYREFFQRLALGEYAAKKMKSDRLMKFIQVYREEFLIGKGIDLMTDCSKR